jgi:BirA family biotin operon repressor/biotin-[acetyl-CoA-carboxylase] ligase
MRPQLPGRRIEWFETIDSTMFEASRLAAAGAASGTTVVAEEQTAGYGRYGRPWHSETEAGLYLSVILRFPFEPETVPLVTLALGLAVVETIGEITGIVCDLRWPNDVLIRERKCAGILTQLEGSAVIAGIGINVNHASFPSDLTAVATSLRIAAGSPQSREKLLLALLPAIDSYCDLLARKGKEPILDMFTHASSYVRGRRVKVDDALEGVTAGLDASGFLLLRDDTGRQHTILAGGVRPCC